VLSLALGIGGRGYRSYPLYLEIRKRSDLFSGVAGRSEVDKASFRAGDGDRRETAQAGPVTGNHFAALGLAPAIGRLSTDDDNRAPKARPLAVLTDGLALLLAGIGVLISI
jgi:hypothetical protein